MATEFFEGFEVVGISNRNREHFSIIVDWYSTTVVREMPWNGATETWTDSKWLDFNRNCTTGELFEEPLPTIRVG